MAEVVEGDQTVSPSSSLISSDSLLPAPEDPQDALIVDDTQQGPKKKFGIFRLSVVALLHLGLSFAWAAMFVFGTPLFQSLGMSHFTTSFAWMAGPVSGFLQPFVGSISDGTRTRIGRRRPYIMFGLVASLIGMTMFSYSDDLGSAVSHGKWLPITLAVCSLWLMNIGLNVIQGPGWALLLDMCDGDQSSLASGIVAAFSAIGSLLATGLGYTDIKVVLPFFDSNYSALFHIGLLTLLLTVIPPLIAAKETSFHDTGVARNASKYQRCGRIVRCGGVVWNSLMNGILDLLRGMKNLWKRQAILRIVILFFCINGMMTPYLFYLTDYFGTEVYGGDADAEEDTHMRDEYDKGVRLGSLSMALLGIVSMITALSVPFILSRRTCAKVFSEKFFFFTSICWGTVVMLLPLWQSSPLLAVLLVTSLGYADGIFSSIPFAILGAACSEEEMGMYVGILNTTQVAAQLLVNLLVGMIVSLSDSVTLGMASGTLFVVVALLMSCIIIVPRPDHEDDGHTKEDEEDEERVGVTLIE